MLLIKPPIHLAGLIVDLWSLRGRPQGWYSGLPKPYVEIIVSLSGKHDWQANKNGPSLRFSEGWVTPVQSAPRFAKTHGPLHLIGARIGIETAAAIFGPALNRGAGAPIPLDHLIGRDASLLREQMHEFNCEFARMKCLGQWIANRLGSRPVLVLPSIETLSDLSWRTDALADYLSLSSRGLRKRFQTQLGISPKFWMQLNRFDGVIGSEINAVGLAETAAAYGYTDQSHMTVEFNRFAGRPPQSYLTTRQESAAPDDAPHYLPGT